MSIYIAIIPPQKAIDAIKKASSQYMEYLHERIPENSWHIPLLEIPTPPNQAPLKQAFHQTIRILSIGKGEDKGSLYVRVQMTPSIAALRTSIGQHLKQQDMLVLYSKDFTPHIYLGSFETMPTFGIIDIPLAMTINIQKLSIIQTDPYEILGSIDIVS